MIDYTTADAAATFARARQQPTVVRERGASRETRLFGADVLDFFDASRVDVGDSLDVADGRFSIGIVTAGEGTIEGDFGQLADRPGRDVRLRRRAGPPLRRRPRAAPGRALSRPCRRRGGAVNAPSRDLPIGLAGLRYPITQVSLAVRDLDATMDRVPRAFGWAPWQVFDHVPAGPPRAPSCAGSRSTTPCVARRSTSARSTSSCSSRSKDRTCGREFMDRRGEGVASIATMFLEREDGDAVKRAFSDRFGIDVIMKADIGDHIEYYYLDTEEQFGCLIESGSGHAIDFVKPAQVYPQPGAVHGPAPLTGLTCAISQVSIVVRDLDSRVAAFETAFGWGPWLRVEPGSGLLRDCHIDGEPVADFEVRFAQARVGQLIVELVEPTGPRGPWADALTRHGEGIDSIAITFPDPADHERFKAGFASLGIGVLASARVGEDDWFLLDSEAMFKCRIASGRVTRSITPDPSLRGPRMCRARSPATKGRDSEKDNEVAGGPWRSRRLRRQVA